MNTHCKRYLIAAVLLGALTFLTTAQAEQMYVPTPTSVEQVPDAGPASGNTMTREYVQTVGQMAYVWGWPLVNMSNRAAAFSKVKEPSVYGGLPMGYNGLAMLTGYISPEQKSVACPNQDMDSTAADKAAIQPVLAQVGVYQLSKFDGKMKTTDWTKTPIITPKSSGLGYRLPQSHSQCEVQYVGERAQRNQIHLS